MGNKKREFLILHDTKLRKFLNGLLEDPSLKKTLDSYTEEIYTTSDTGETYRTINSWDSDGLLLTLPNRDSKWRKFSLIEIIWIYIIRELRGFGLSKEKILRIRDCIFPTLPDGEISDTNRFKQYILSVVAKRDVYLIVTPNGEGDLAIDIELIETERSKEGLPKTYTIISINQLCAEFTGNKEYSKKNQFLYIPTNKELNLLNEVKNSKEIKEVTMVVKDNKITRLNYKKEQNPKEAVTILNKLIKEGGRKEVNIKIENGTVVYAEEIDKK
jgi:hypothetical protein